MLVLLTKIICTALIILLPIVAFLFFTGYTDNVAAEIIILTCIVAAVLFALGCVANSVLIIWDNEALLHV